MRFWRMLIASLDEEAQEDLRANKNFGTYKGAIYENAVGEMLRKSGYEQLYFYRHDNPSLEMDFFVRDANSLVPVEVKARDGDFFFHNWLRNRNTIEFLGIWEKVHNPSFNSVEFDIIKSQAGLPNFVLSVSEWLDKTNAIGLIFHHSII